MSHVNELFVENKNRNIRSRKNKKKIKYKNIYIISFNNYLNILINQ